MEESIIEFCKSVDIDHCRVSNTPHLIFLCGGVTKRFESSPLLSARHFFYHFVKKNAADILPRIRLAEEINEWFDEDTFADLLELEAHLADSSDLIVLFVESPGSIAELGAFASNELLRSRTLAIMNSKYDDSRSFISDGPVRRIKRLNQDFIQYYEWNDREVDDASNNDIFDEMSKELIEYVRERTTATPKERLLDRNSHGHGMFLIADLIDILGITTATEILDCLNLWGYSSDAKQLKKYLFLLQHLKLVKRKLHSNQTYFLSGIESPLIRYDFYPNAKIRDRERIKTTLRAALFERDKRRMKVYQRELSKRTVGRHRV